MSKIITDTAVISRSFRGDLRFESYEKRSWTASLIVLSFMAESYNSKRRKQIIFEISKVGQ